MPVKNKKRIKEKFLESLRKHLGVLTPACKEVKIGRVMIWKWRQEDEVFNQQVIDIQEESIDFVEYELFKQIQAGGAAQTIFYLKTKAKHRGYVEQINIQELKPIQIDYIVPEGQIYLNPAQDEKDIEIDE